MYTANHTYANRLENNRQKAKKRIKKHIGNNKFQEDGIQNGGRTITNEIFIEFKK